MKITEKRAVRAVPNVDGDRDPELHDPERARLLWLMSEYFRLNGCTDVRARLPDFIPPSLLEGTAGSHRPDFTCRLADRYRTPLVMEIVTPAGVVEPSADLRWTLLADAARVSGAELHFVVPRWSIGGSVEHILRRRLDELGVRPTRLWLV